MTRPACNCIPIASADDLNHVTGMWDGICELHGGFVAHAPDCETRTRYHSTAEPYYCSCGAEAKRKAQGSRVRRRA